MSAQLNPPREASVIRSIERYLKTLAPAVCYVNIPGGPFMRAGTPDIILSVGGWFCALEVKRPGGKPTPIQVAELHRWQASGAIVAVVTSVAEARAIVDPVLRSAAEALNAAAPEPAEQAQEAMPL